MATTTNTKTFTKILASLAALPIALTGLGLTAAPASAVPQIDPGFFDLELPLVGFNEQPPEWFNEVPDFELPSLTVEVVVDCEADPQVRVDISNTTEDFYWVEAFADGDAMGPLALVGPNMDRIIELDFAENDSKEIRVESGDLIIGEDTVELVMFEDTVELDCVLSAPSYEILENCDTGQTHARLINLGDDSVDMAVAFPDVMYAQQTIAPHSSIDWLLPSSADGPVEFDIMADDVVIGHEIVEMDCVFSEPGYEVIENCDTGQAYVLLINSGDDSVDMAVAFPDVMYAQQTIAPHSSIDWLLPSSADGPVEFDIMADDVVIGHEIVEMDCEVPAEVEAAKENAAEVEAAKENAAEVEAAKENAAEVEAAKENAAEEGSDLTQTVDPEAADGGSDKLAAGVDVEVAPGSGSSPWVALAATMGGLALLAGAAVAWSRSQRTVG